MGLFDEVYGYDEVKELFNLSLKSEKPVHILLCGPPASGKTLFLMALENLPLKTKHYLGGQTSKAGLTEVLLKEKPDILILDELDKMSSKDYDVLLSLMETGRVVRCKYNLWSEDTLSTKVYGACNRTDRIPTELLSRFLIVEFKPYTPQEFIDVSKHVLKVREGLTDEEATKLSELLVSYTRDVRDAVKAARLLKSGANLEFIAKIFSKNRQSLARFF
ncbi:MAG: ATP-binding protein [Thermoproteota archaeon]